MTPTATQGQPQGCPQKDFNVQQPVPPYDNLKLSAVAILPTLFWLQDKPHLPVISNPNAHGLVHTVD
jgi:hypothetical protein